MNPLQETAISCPYCGEGITILIDGSVQEQKYIEDCEVCCQPMDIRVRLSANGESRIEARHEDDV